MEFTDFVLDDLNRLNTNIIIYATPNETSITEVIFKYIENNKKNIGVFTSSRFSLFKIDSMNTNATTYNYNKTKNNSLIISNTNYDEILFLEHYNYWNLNSEISTCVLCDIRFITVIHYDAWKIYKIPHNTTVLDFNTADKIHNYTQTKLRNLKLNCLLQK